MTKKTFLPKRDLESQVKDLLEIIKKYPHLENVLNEADTVGDEKALPKGSF